MDKIGFLFKAIEMGAPLDKEWTFRAMSWVTKTDKIEDIPGYPYHNDGWWYFVDDHGEYIKFHKGPEETPLFTRDEPIVIPKGNPLSPDKELVTTMGTLILNLLVIYYPFGGRIPFINEAVIPKRIDKLWLGLIEDDDVTMKELLASSAGASQLTSFTPITTPSFTKRSTMACPAAIKELKRLLKVHEKELDDPAIVADIITKVYAIDKAWIEDDPDGGAGFLISDKAYRQTRMNLLYLQVMHGGGKVKLTPALKEGFNLDTYVESVNHSMKGSLDRGFNTALGGVAVKEILLLLAMAQIKEDDCGSKIGVRLLVTKDHLPLLNGRYIIEGNKNVELTKDNIKGYLGKSIILRDPNACKSDSFCRICCGNVIGNNPESIKGQGIVWGSVMVNLFMQAMHGTDLATENYDIHSSIS